MIWCVEDDAGIREIEIYTLQSTGFEARGFADGTAFFEALKSEKPELLILDIMLPGDDGLDILRKIRESYDTTELPVIMATAKGQEYDKIKSLDMGADDYLVKPFGMMEMVSRVKAVLRRCAPKEKENLLKAGNIVIDTEKRTVLANCERVELTYEEFEILRLLMSHPGMVYSRDKLLYEIWDTDYVGETRTVDVHIRTLRQKLGESGSIIETVRHVGYKLEG